jgi:hypothetical protein
MDRLEELLRHVREPRACAELLLGAPAEAAAVARQLAAVLFSLPAVHQELGEQRVRLPAVAELVRRVGLLELLLLKAAAHRSGESLHANHPSDARLHRPARGRRLRNPGRVATIR